MNVHMANQHYGKIGDVWKHLPLAHTVKSLAPKLYMETHAGNATYELTHSPERDFGVYRFLAGADKSKPASQSAYLDIVRHFASQSQPLYPGSPAIALRTLGAEARYLFCDTDARSLSNIRDFARFADVPETHVECASADGVPAVLERAWQLSEAQLAECFVMVDPCGGDLPFADNPARTQAPAPIDAFCQLADVGVPAMFWYGLDGVDHRSQCWDRIRKSIDQFLPDPSLADLWTGEIYLGIFESKDYRGVGMRGCGVLLANVPPSVVMGCEMLGEAMADIYRGAKLPDGGDGSIRYASFAF